MSTFQQKITGHTKKQKTQLEETEQAPEPESDMTGMFKLSDQKLFFKTMTYML